MTGWVHAAASVAATAADQQGPVQSVWGWRRYWPGWPTAQHFEVESAGQRQHPAGGRPAARRTCHFCGGAGSLHCRPAPPHRRPCSAHLDPGREVPWATHVPAHVRSARLVAEGTQGSARVPQARGPMAARGRPCGTHAGSHSLRTRSYPHRHQRARKHSSVYRHPVSGPQGLRRSGTGCRPPRPACVHTSSIQSSAIPCSPC